METWDEIMQRELLSTDIPMNQTGLRLNCWFVLEANGEFISDNFLGRVLTMFSHRPLHFSCSVQSMEDMGNSKGRAVYEAGLPDNYKRPMNSDSAMEVFIRAKYEHKKYIAKEWIPPKPRSQPVCSHATVHFIRCPVLLRHFVHSLLRLPTVAGRGLLRPHLATCWPFEVTRWWRLSLLCERSGFPVTESLKKTSILRRPSEGFKRTLFLHSPHFHLVLLLDVNHSSVGKMQRDIRHTSL